MSRKKAALSALAVTVALTAAYFLWQRGWVLRQARAILVLTADSLTVAGVLALLVGLVLRGRKSGRPLITFPKTDPPPDLTEEDLARARRTRRTLGTALCIAAAAALGLSLVLSGVYLAMT